MSNKCINQLILSGDRKSIFDLITDEKLHYSTNKISLINENTFSIVFSSDWFPPKKYFYTLSKQYPCINFEIFYAIKLSGTKGYLHILDGDISEEKENNAFTMSEMTKQLSSDNFYIKWCTQ